MSKSLVCWKCGASLEAVLIPFSRREECPDCHTDLHVCRMCEFYDTSVSRSCREPIADEVRDKERANFCGYFKPIPGAHQSKDSAASDDAKSKLAALFGDTVNPQEDAEKNGQTDADAARDRLNRLFGIDGSQDD
jgi:hypothetical protein